MEPSPFLVSSGNAFSPGERREMRRQGAVGDICLRFFDQMGKPIKSTLNSRVINIELETLKRVGHVVAVAGGPGKVPAILGALRSQRINALITDRQTAESLLGAESV